MNVSIRSAQQTCLVDLVKTFSSGGLLIGLVFYMRREVCLRRDPARGQIPLLVLYLVKVFLQKV